MSGFLFFPVLVGGSEPGLQGFEILGLDNLGVTGLAGWDVLGLAGWEVAGLEDLGVPGLGGLDVLGVVRFFVLGLEDLFLPGLVGLDNSGLIGEARLSSPTGKDRCPGNRGSPDGPSGSSPLTTALR